MLPLANKGLAAATHPAKPAMGRPRLAREDPLETAPHRLAARQEVEVEADPLARPRRRRLPLEVRTMEATTRLILGAAPGTSSTSIGRTANL